MQKHGAFLFNFTIEFCTDRSEERILDASLTI